MINDFRRERQELDVPTRESQKLDGQKQEKLQNVLQNNTSGELHELLEGHKENQEVVHGFEVSFSDDPDANALMTPIKYAVRHMFDLEIIRVNYTEFFFSVPDDQLEDLQAALEQFNNSNGVSIRKGTRAIEIKSDPNK